MQEHSSAQQHTTARVKSGIYNQVGPFVGKTVSQIRNEFKNTWKIEDGAKAMKGKTELAEDYVIQENDEIQFWKVSGEKGA